MGLRQVHGGWALPRMVLISGIPDPAAYPEKVVTSHADSPASPTATPE